MSNVRGTKEDAMPKKTPAPKTRGGRHRMLLELDEEDFKALDKLDERYRDMTGVTKSNRVFVIRQLIRIASGWNKLPPIKVT